MSDFEDIFDIPKYLTFDDVLLLPNYTEFSYADVILKSKLTETISLDIPIISSPMDTVTEVDMLLGIGKLGGIGILHRNLSIDTQVDMMRRALEAGVQAGAAVGAGPDFQERVDALVKAGVQLICVDSAHGNNRVIIEAVKYLKQKYPNVQLIAGNVATYDGAKALFEAGADAVRVGMGPGSICTTRIMSGVGVPQLSAIADTVKAAKEYNRHIIADGGITVSGDIVKALAAGASSVMLGSLLAGTDEAPGEILVLQEKKYKVYRGMGSVASMKRGSASRYGQVLTPGAAQNLVPEGVEGLVPYTGALKDHLHQLLGGIRSGLFYQGCRDVEELQKKARFIRITKASMAESRPHSIILTSYEMGKSE